jgi:SAM-dependent methyltransferase
MESVTGYYDKLGQTYIDQTDEYWSRYHTLRLTTAVDLIGRYGSPGKLFDFGCGSGELLDLLEGYDVRGCDISQEMLRLAGARHADGDFRLGGIEFFEKVEDEFAVIVALNVLPYLSAEEEGRFYRQARRLLADNGVLVISHTNELFDLVTFNRYTIDMFEDRLLPALELSDDARNAAMAAFRALLSEPDHPPQSGKTFSERDVLKKRRADPFTYRPAGFELREQRCINCFPLPPRILQSTPELGGAQLGAHRHLSGTLLKIFCSQFQLALMPLPD